MMTTQDAFVESDLLNRMETLLACVWPVSRTELEALAIKTEARIVEDDHRDFIIRRDLAVPEISCLLSGWAMRFIVLPDGRRQILEFETPGSYICVQAIYSEKLPFSVQTLTPTTRLVMQVDPLIEALKDLPGAAALFTMLGYKILVEAEDKITGLGRRDAVEKISRLILKIYAQLRSIGLAETPAFEFPLRQNNIADATGLTTVHVNRVLKQLRYAGTIALGKGVIEILDLDGLLALAGMTEDEIDPVPLAPRGGSFGGAAVDMRMSA